MQVNDFEGWTQWQRLAEQKNARPKAEFFGWEVFIDPLRVIPIPSWKTSSPQYPEGKAVVLIEFDQEGFVISPNNHSGPLRGRLNRIRYLVLSEGEGLTDKIYALAEWFTGRDEDTPLDVTPAFCSDSFEMPSPFSTENKYYIYGNLFKPEAGDKLGFGCREWAYQLHSTDRPYIDVTTYGPRSKRFPHGTYINDFIGWSTFGVKKPVIGKHADTWYCLHECPSGDQPGKIDNIKLWAAGNGWKPPKPPTRVPTFTDDPQRRGTYVD